VDINYSVRLIFSVALFSAVFSCPSFAEHRDPAPIPEDIAQKIVARTHGVPLTLPRVLQRHLDETEQLLEDEARQERMTRGPLSTSIGTRAMLLRGKLHELEIMRIELRSEIDRMRTRLAQRGLARQARAMDDLRAKIENRFDRLTTALAALRDAGDARGRDGALAKARQLMQELHGRVRERELDLGTPQPTFRMEQPAPGPAPPASPVPPAYLSGPAGPGGNMFAMLGDALMVAVAPPTPSEAQSCYASGSIDAADLAENMEVTLTPEIRSLAEKLGYSPARIFEYVHNEIRFEPYYGSLKGAVGALYSKAGGPTDQASLLIALLRASNIPARYVRGTIQVKDVTDMGANGRGPRWIGAKSYKAAAYILGQGKFPSWGYAPGVLQLGHVWVEACVPYGNYRGASSDPSGHRWIPLDPSFKDKTYQAGIVTSVDFDYTGYMAARGNELPHEKYERQVESWIKTQPPHYANNTLEDVGYIGRQAPGAVDILPATLPYEVSLFTVWTRTGTEKAPKLTTITGTCSA
jgi:transglutaminase-like putative cysteine protease